MESSGRAAIRQQAQGVATHVLSVVSKPFSSAKRAQSAGRKHREEEEEEEEEEEDDDDNSVYVAAPDPSILEQKDFDVRKEFLNGQVVWAHTELPIEDSKCKTIWWPAYVYHSMEVSLVRAAAT